MRKLFLLIPFLFLLTSCRLTDFTVISTKNVTLDVKKDARRTKAWGWTVKDAIDNAIEAAGPGYDALIDGVVSSRFIGYSVKGTPIKTTEKK